MTTFGPRAPREVFISYSHDSPEHANRVLELASQLRENGIPITLDQWEESPPEGWPRWMEIHVADADFVLVICTERYNRRFNGEEEPGLGLGVRWEANLIRQHLYNCGSINDRFVPVVFAPDSKGHIPIPLQGYTHYVLDTKTGYDRLYRRLTSQLESIRPPLGRLQALPPRERVHGFFPGVQPALSSVPLTTRTFSQTELIGREDQQRWLRDTHGDRLVIGHPGSGKTHLLASLARQGWGLFVVGDNLDQIALELEMQAPEVLIVDDTHFKVDLLRQLLHLRQVTSSTFAIVATSWPGGAHEVANALVLPCSHTLELPLLTRDQIVQVIKAAGLGGPDPLISEIVNQAEGRPGLAVTLAQLCLQDGVKDVALGDAISRSVRSDFEKLVGPRSIELLAAFGIGGNAGMQLDVVAEALGLAVADVRGKAAGLAAGGLIVESSHQWMSEVRLAVRPAALRHALVRDVFFNSPARLSYRQLAESAPHLSDVALTLVGACAVGANVGRDEIIALLEHAQSIQAWTAFAWLGSAEASQVLHLHPELAVELARPLFHYVPNKTIPFLLGAAVGDKRELGPHPEHPLRLLRDWIEDTEPDSADAISRRGMVLAAISEWISAGNDEDVASHALSMVVAPKFERHSTDPGMGTTMTIRWGPLSADRLRELDPLWCRVVAKLKSLHRPSWRYILSVVTDWAYPRRLLDRDVPADIVEAMRLTASRMIADLCVVSKGHQGVLRRLRSVANALDMDVSTAVDSCFDTLYPSSRGFEDPSAYHLILKSQLTAVDMLAADWAARDPIEIAKLIAKYEREAGDVGVSWPRYTPDLCVRLAAASQSPIVWLHALRDLSASADTMAPFLRKAMTSDEPGWEDLANSFLERPELSHVAASLLLTAAEPPAILMSSALAVVPNLLGLIELHCVRNEVPEHTLVRLLRHEDPAVAGMAAVGEWLAVPMGTVRPSLQPDWHSAIIRYGTKSQQAINSPIQRSEHIDYWVAEILKHDADLALDWLRSRLASQPRDWHWKLAEPDAAAVDALDFDRRIDLLEIIPVDAPIEILVQRLVGSDLRLYGALLSQNNLRPLHLIPLSGRPVDGWVSKASLALEAGFSFEDIAGAAFHQLGIVTFWGDESAVWDTWVTDLTNLCSHHDKSIRTIGEVGLAIATRLRTQALSYEHQKRVFGL